MTEGGGSRMSMDVAERKSEAFTAETDSSRRMYKWHAIYLSEVGAISHLEVDGKIEFDRALERLGEAELLYVFKGHLCEVKKVCRYEVVGP